MTSSRSCQFLMLLVGLYCQSIPATAGTPLDFPGKTDLVFLIDASISIPDVLFGKIKTFVKNIYDDVSFGGNDVAAGILLFATDVYIEYTNTNGQQLDGSVPLYPKASAVTIDTFLNDFNRDAANMKTNTHKGLAAGKEMMMNMGRQDATKILVLITDGVSDDNTQTIVEAEQFRVTDIYIVAIAVGLSDLSELNRIVHATPFVHEIPTAVFEAVDDTDLVAKRSEITAQLSSIANYYNDDHKFVDHQPLDVYFLMDWTTSATQYNSMNLIIKNVMNRFNHRDARVGIIGMHDEVPSYVIPLGEYELNVTLFGALDSMVRQGGAYINVEAALEFLENALQVPLVRHTAAVLLVSQDSSTDASSIATSVQDKDLKLMAIYGGAGTMDNRLRSWVSDSSVLWTTNFGNNDFSALTDSVAGKLNSVADGSFISGGGTINAGQVDLVFLIDGSGQVDADREGSLIKYSINEMVKRIQLGPGYGRVGLLVYDGVSAYYSLPLGDHPNLNQLIENIPFISRTAEADNALGINEGRYMFDMYGRDGVRRVMFMFTTSGSANLYHSQIETLSAEIIDDIHLYKVFIPDKPTTTEYTNGENGYIETGEDLGSSVVTESLTQTLETIVTATGQSPGPHPPWDVDIDAILMAEHTTDLTQFRAFVNSLKSRFNGQRLRIGIASFRYKTGGDGSMSLLSLGRLPLTYAENIDPSTIDLNIVEGGTGVVEGPIDMRQYFASSARPGAARAAFIVAQSDPQLDLITTSQTSSTTEPGLAGVYVMAAATGQSATSPSYFSSLASHEDLFHSMQDLTLTEELEIQLASASSPDNLVIPAQFIPDSTFSPTDAGILFVLDASTHAQGVMEQVKTFVLALAEGFTYGDVELIVVTLGSSGVVAEISSTDYTTYADWYNAVNELTTDVTSPTANVDITALMPMLTSQENHIVLFTHGFANIDQNELEQDVAEAVTAGFFVTIVNTDGDSAASNDAQAIIADANVLTLGQSDLEDVNDLNTVHSLLGDAANGNAPKCDVELDLALIIDTSFSISQSGFSRLKQALFKIVERFPIPLTRVAIVAISDTEHIVMRLRDSTSVTSIIMTIALLQQNGISTDTAAAIQDTTEMFRQDPPDGGRLQVPWIYVILTDGKPTDPHSTMVMAKLAMLRGVHIEAVGVGDNINTESLDEISSHIPMLFPDYDELGVTEKIGNHICSVAKTYDPANIPEPFKCTYRMDISIVGYSLADDTKYDVFTQSLVTNSDDRFVSSVKGDSNLDILFENAINALPAPSQRPLSSRVLILVSEELTSQDKAMVMTKTNKAKLLGIVVVIVDAGTVPNTDLTGAASGDSLYFQDQNFDENPTLEISCCIEPCTAGSERVIQNNAVTCSQCEKDYFQDPDESYICQQCPGDKITPTIGSTSEDSCIVPQCTTPMDLALVVDISFSFAKTEQMFNTLKSKLSDLIGKFEGQDVKIAVIPISDTTATIYPLDDNTAMAQLFILTGIVARSTETNTADALETARDDFRTNGRNGIANIVVLFTDGKSSNVQQARLQATLAKMDGITVMVVAVGDNLDYTELKALSHDGVFKEYATIENIDNEIITQDACEAAKDYDPTPVTFTCEHPMDISIVHDLTPAGLARYNSFKDKISDTQSTIQERSGNIVTEFTNAVNQFISQSAAPSTRLLILILDGVLTVPEKTALTSTSLTARDNGIVVAVIDANDPSNDLDAVASPYMIFDDEAFDESLEIEVSCCIEPCEGGKERGVENNAVTCIECQKDNFRDPGVSYTCVQCPDGKITQGPGAANEALCTAVCSTDSPCMNGGVCDETLPLPVCNCPDGYYGNECQIECISEVDIAFVVDVSHSIGVATLTLIKAFLKDIAYRSRIADDKMRIAIVQFGQSAETIHSFTNHPQTSNDVGQSINNIGTTSDPNLKLSSYPNLGILKGLDLLQGLTERYDRHGTIVLLYDGKSDDPDVTIEAARVVKDALIRLFVLNMAVDGEETDEILEIISNYDSMSFQTGPDTYITTRDLLNEICEDTFTCDKDLSVHAYVDQRDTVDASVNELVTQIQQSFTGDASFQISNFNNQAQLSISQEPPYKKARVVLVVLKELLSNEYIINNLYDIKENSGYVAFVWVNDQPVPDVLYAIASARDLVFKGSEFSEDIIARSVSRGCCLDPLCSTDADCENGGDCVTNEDPPNVCECPAIFAGAYCEICLCENGGVCIEDTQATPGYTCVCQLGFMGEVCETVWNECTDEPCKNGATCISDPGNPLFYRCECAAGYLGRNCTEVDQCATTPCKNGGTCTKTAPVSGPQSYSCECEPGWTGRDCGEAVDPCDAAPCKNGGICSKTAPVSGPQSYSCECAPGWTGRDCGEEVDPCDGAPCKNGGICTKTAPVSGPQSYSCECAPGWTGRDCGEEVDPCDADPCKNGGICTKTAPVSGPESYSCECAPGWTGRDCGEEVDPCDADPCKNGGTCTKTAPVSGPESYSCECAPRWTGRDCGEEVDPCNPDPCKNGGMCTKTAPVSGSESYSCECASGWTGRDCGEEVDPCDAATCKNGGICTKTAPVSGPESYSCECAPGWTGRDCGEEVDPCGSDPCKNGGICTKTAPVSGPESYSCECAPRWTGRDCGEEVDPCDAAPCKNGGICTKTAPVSGPESYSCECAPGWTGHDCGEEVDPCDAAPCKNGGICTKIAPVSGPQSYSCECAPGWTGHDCGEDPCDADPCKNGGICTKTAPVSGPQSYSCECAPGWTGRDCGEEVDPCDAAPCKNGGICTKTAPVSGPQSYSCECAPGWTGRDCGEEVDPCDAAPCKNGGICAKTAPVSGPQSYSCECAPGWTGGDCGEEVDPCDVAPCKNGGICTKTAPVSGPESYSCECAPGWTGRDCGEEVDPCDAAPCKNGGICTKTAPVSGPQSYSCECAPGWTGRDCGEEVDPCDAAPCKNGGICTKTAPVSGPQSYSCECAPGWTGRDCGEEVDPCDAAPCKNGGICTKTAPVSGPQSYSCECAPGWTGRDCGEEVDPCDDAPCKNGGICTKTAPVSGPQSYSCECAPGWTGRDCGEEVDPCDAAPCKNGGICAKTAPVSGPQSYSCECAPGWTGRDCGEEVDPCDVAPCKNGGICTKTAPVSGPQSYSCECAPGWTGRDCGEEVDPCDAAPCKNGGICTKTAPVSGPQSYSCECAPGWTGHDCGEEVDPCDAAPCKNGGICSKTAPVSGPQSYSCECAPGWTGRDCGEEIVPCDAAPCKNGGTCTKTAPVSGPQSYSCKCAPGWTGRDCGEEVDPCDAAPCKNGGNCTKTAPVSGPESYSCECAPGWTGRDCGEEVDPCDAAPCKNGGICTKTAPVSGPQSYSCECAPGWTGRDCGEEVDPCDAAPCKNGGICTKTAPVSGPLSYSCECALGWTGRDCGEETDWCQGHDCVNGDCITDSGTRGYTCECVYGWTGFYCNEEWNECQEGPCKNGGTCTSSTTDPTNYDCECVSGFQGKNCTETDWCHEHNCVYGKCITNSGTTGYTCDCDDGWTGSVCNKEWNECQEGPCKNGGTCTPSTTDPTNYDCECTPGFIGKSCTETDWCHGHTCVHGDCITNSGTTGYTCDCDDGWTGPNCNEEWNECQEGPCKNGGTCTPSTTDPTNYDCECTPGFKGKNCTETDWCHGHTCVHGDCITNSGTTGYTCDCDDGWTGPNCNEEWNECQEGPCKNGGTCTPSTTDPTNYDCECAPGFQGKDCTETDWCHGHTCVNGDCITSTGTTGYTCLCVDGWTGPYCNEEDTIAPDNECASLPCLNGGQCVWAVPFYCICTFTPISGSVGLSCDTAVNCPAGSNFNNILGTCVPCPNGFYRAAGDPDCLACPAGQATGRTGSVTMTDCVQDPCDSGFELTDFSCTACPIGTYKNRAMGDVACQQCPTRYSTKYAATWSVRSCKFVPCSGPLDLVIAVDMSNPVHTGLIQTWLKNFVRGFRLGPRHVRISILRFSDQVDCIIPLRYGTHPSRICTQISRQLYPGATNAVNTTKALEDVLAQLQTSNRHDVPAAALIINDNNSDNIIAATTVATTLRNNGVHMTSIGTVLKDVVNLASNRQSQFLISGYEDLPSRAAVIETLCG